MLTSSSLFPPKFYLDPNIKPIEKHKLDGHTRAVSTITVMADGRLASGSADHTIRLWNVMKGECETILSESQDHITTLTALPNGLLASGSVNKTIQLWNVSSRKCEMTLSGHQGVVFTLAMLPNGNLASGSSDKTIRIWNLSSGKCDFSFKAHKTPKYTLTTLQNGLLVSGSADHAIQLLNENLHTSLLGHTGAVHALTVLSDGRLASGSADKTIRLWNVSRKTCEMILSEHKGLVLALATLPDGRLASGSSDNTIRLWNVINGKCEITLLGHQAQINALTVLHNGFLASGSADNTIRLWDIGLRSISEVENYHEKEEQVDSRIEEQTNGEDQEKTSKITLPPQQPLIEQEEWSVLQKKSALYESNFPIDEITLQSTLIALQNRLNESNHLLLSVSDQKEMAIKLSKDRAAKAEVEFISKNPIYSEYFHAFTTHFSAMMAAASTISSGYVDVNKSIKSSVASWAESLVTTVFPRAKLLMSVITKSVEYIDISQRASYLNKLQVFGGSLKAADNLGEEVALLLIRAYFHANSLKNQSKIQAQEDCQKILNTIAITEPPIPHNEHTPKELFRIVWGNQPYNLSWIAPVNINTLEALEYPSNELKVEQVGSVKQSIVTMSLDYSEHSTLEESVLVLQQRLDSLQKETVQQEHLSQLQREIRNLKEKVGDRSTPPSVTAGSGGQLLRLAQKNTADFMENSSSAIVNEKHYIHIEQHVQELTTQFLNVQEKVESLSGKEYVTLKQLLQSSLIEGVKEYRRHYQNKKLTIHGSKKYQEKCIALEEQTAQRENIRDILSDLIAHFNININSNSRMDSFSLDTCLIKAIENRIGSEISLLQRKMSEIVLLPTEEKLLSRFPRIRGLPEYRIKREKLKRALTAIRNDLPSNQSTSLM